MGTRSASRAWNVAQSTCLNCCATGRESAAGSCPWLAWAQPSLSGLVVLPLCLCTGDSITSVSRSAMRCAYLCASASLPAARPRRAASVTCSSESQPCSVKRAETTSDTLSCTPQQKARLSNVHTRKAERLDENEMQLCVLLAPPQRLSQHHAAMDDVVALRLAAQTTHSTPTDSAPRQVLPHSAKQEHGQELGPVHTCAVQASNASVQISDAPSSTVPATTSAAFVCHYCVAA